MPLPKARKAVRLGVLLAILVLCAVAAGWAGDRTASLQHQLAKEELALAKTPSLYFILYSRTKALVLKSRGLTLQEWKVRSIHAWGAEPPLEALTLEKKSALFPPKRARIKPAPAGEEEASFELDALELKDMPSRFTLFLSGGIRVYVRPAAKGFFPRLGSLGHLIPWTLWIPLKNLFYRLRKVAFAAIDVKLDKSEDGQSLYWALPDKVTGLVFPL
jgi:hypothetical protein